MKGIHENDIKGIKYESDEYSYALEEAVEIFNFNYCHVDIKQGKISCLERFEHDGTDKNGIEYAVGIYCLGDIKDECPIIYLITDGYKYYWGTNKDEHYNDAIREDRMFYEEDFVDTIDGKMYTQKKY